MSNKRHDEKENSKILFAKTLFFVSVTFGLFMPHRCLSNAVLEMLCSKAMRQLYYTVCVTKDSSVIYRLDIVCTTQLSVFSYSGFFFKITKPSIIGAREISVQ